MWQASFIEKSTIEKNRILAIRNTISFQNQLKADCYQKIFQIKTIGFVSFLNFNLINLIVEESALLPFSIV